MLYNYLGRREEAKVPFVAGVTKPRKLSCIRKNYCMEMHSVASIHHNFRSRGSLQGHLQTDSFLKPVCFQPGDCQRASLR